jgi:hypothetical protein
MALIINRVEAAAWQKRYDAQAPRVGNEGKIYYHSA